MERTAGLGNEMPLLPGAASGVDMVARRGRICTIAWWFGCVRERGRVGETICGSVLDGDASDRAPTTPAQAAWAGVPTEASTPAGVIPPAMPAPEQAEESAAVDQLFNDESGAQGAQGLSSAWSDPDWALLCQPLVRGPSTGLRRSLDEGHRYECSPDEVFGGVD